MSPFGAFFCGKGRKKKNRGFHFNEGFTPPSLSLCRPLCFEGISILSTFSTFSTLSTLFSEGHTPLLLCLFRIVELLQFKCIFPCVVNKNEHIFLGIKVLPLRILYYIRVLGSISICFRILEGQL